MKRSLICLLITTLLVKESKATCAEWKQLESDCGSYCLKVLRPVLDHTKALQSEVNDFRHQTESLKVLHEKSDVNDNRVEHKLEDLRRTIDIALLKQMESNIKQSGDFLGKFQNVEHQLENIDVLESKLEDKFDNIGKITEATIQKHIADLTAKLNDLYKINNAEKLTEGKSFKKIGSKYYYIENTKKANWFVAAHKCLELGGHLASIQNLWELLELNAHLQSYVGYWIDINDLGTEGVFLSATTGVRPNYFHWHKGEPNNAGKIEDCVSYNKNYMMNDDNCNKEKWFICESGSVN